MVVIPLHDVSQSSISDRGQVVGRQYQLLEVVGDGGFSTVWRARCIRPFSLPSIVAVKQSKKRREARWAQIVQTAFDREATFLLSLLHPCVPHLYDAFSEGEQHYLVMDYIAGESLAQYLKRERIPTSVALHWGYLLCQLLAHVHKRNIIYRDMKPENILVPARAQEPLVLVDFGLAIGGNLNGNEQSVDGLSQFGTYEYASSEQLQGEVVTQFSDVYSLALVLFYLLTGINPVQYRPAPGDALALRHLPGITEELVWLFAQMLSESPEHRPDIDTVTQALLKVLPSHLSEEELCMAGTAMF